MWKFVFVGKGKTTMGIMSKIFGTRSQREVKRLQPLVGQIEALGPACQKLSDGDLAAKTKEFQQRYQNGETLDALLPEAFAVCREAADRVLGMRPYPVQLIGGIVLHQGRIAEMKTGEGKTLVAILPAYLNALAGKGVHIVTVNEYLAKRDSEWMGKVYRFLGLTVGLVIPGMTSPERKKAYAADITYCTNNELGFDYLRDNMAIYKEELVQRGHSFAIVDEVDSILIDEARTPLIISGKGEASTKLYEMADFFVSGLRKLVFAKTDEKEAQDDYDCDYIVDEKNRSVSLTASGIAKAEQFFGVENLADPDNTTLNHHINQAMKARGLMKKDIDYVVKDGQIIIVDEFTGRLMYGRRYNEGLHQAIEAKEGVTVANESKTLATITFQNFFRLYDKLSGMTGTALTEEEEFSAIYKLDVVEIPTNRPVIRVDHSDVVYKNEAGKLRAIVRQVQECHAKGQPVLVGTISIEKSELVSRMLKRENVPHTVLNAKYHEKEAQIVAQAGKLGAVTISTNMAGRGTDIKLGEGVRELGGLCVIGTERHESRRIDNQLRGRSGRQGDPGESQFYLSLEDELMRRFGSERIKAFLDRFIEEDNDVVIKSRMLTNQVESAQRRVEGNNYDTRKQVLQYDDVMREQREIIYAERYDVITAERDLAPEIKAIIKRTIERTVDSHSQLDRKESLDAILNFAKTNLLPEDTISLHDIEDLNYEDIKDLLYDAALKNYDRQIAKLRDEEAVREFQKVLILMVVDNKWTDHIDALDQLRSSVGLRGYAQNNPIVEYQSEGFRMFQDMIGAIEFDVTRTMMKAQIHEQEREKETESRTTAEQNISAQSTISPQDPIFKNVGRNDKCPCGSGKKFKNCHGRKRF